MPQVRRAPKPKSIKRAPKGHAVGSRPVKKPTIRQKHGPAKGPTAIKKGAKSFSLLPEAAAYQAPAKVLYQAVTKGGELLRNKSTGKIIRKGRVVKQTTTLAQSNIARDPTPVLDAQAFWKKQKKIKIKGYPRGSTGGKPQYKTRDGVTIPASYPVELSGIGSVTRGQQADVLGRLWRKDKVGRTSFTKTTPAHFAYPENTGYNAKKVRISAKKEKITTVKSLITGKAPEIKIKKLTKQKGVGNRKITEFGIAGGAVGGVGVWDQFTSFFNQPLIPEASAAVGTSAISKKIVQLTKEIQVVKDGKMMFISDAKRNNYVQSRLNKIVKLEQKLADRGGQYGQDVIGNVAPSDIIGKAYSPLLAGKQTVSLARAPKFDIGGTVPKDVKIPGGKKIKIHDPGSGKKGRNKSLKYLAGGTATLGGLAVASQGYNWFTQGADMSNVGPTDLDKQVQVNKDTQITAGTVQFDEPAVGTQQGSQTATWRELMSGGDLLGAQHAFAASTVVSSASPQPGMQFTLPGEAGKKDPSYTMVNNQWVKIGPTSRVSSTQLEGLYARQTKIGELNTKTKLLRDKMRPLGSDLHAKAVVARDFYAANPDMGKLPRQYKVILDRAEKQKQINPAVQAIAWQSGGPYQQSPTITITPGGKDNPNFNKQDEEK